MKNLRIDILGAAGLGLALLTCPTQNSFADFYPGYVNCQTESNGLPFNASEMDPSLARNMAVNACTGDSRTNNDECRANLWCSDQGAYPTPMISCQTESNGLNFSKSERDETLARNLAVQVCTNDSRTNNDECRANVYCNDGYNPPHAMVTCSTDSNGLDFSHSDRDSGLARQLALGSCTNDSRTNNDECRANLWCNDTTPYAPPMYTCSTQSNGLTFGRSERDVNLARQLAVSTCSNDSRTNNDECRANVWCDNGGYPGPQPQPQPQPHPPVPVPPGPGPHPPIPVPPGPGPGPHAGPCYNRCAIGEMCTDGCPVGGVCNLVQAMPQYWRVLSCR